MSSILAIIIRSFTCSTFYFLMGCQWPLPLISITITLVWYLFLRSPHFNSINISTIYATIIFSNPTPVGSTYSDTTWCNNELHSQSYIVEVQLPSQKNGKQTTNHNLVLKIILEFYLLINKTSIDYDPLNLHLCPLRAYFLLLLWSSSHTFLLLFFFSYPHVAFISCILHDDTWSPFFCMYSHALPLSSLFLLTLLHIFLFSISALMHTFFFSLFLPFLECFLPLHIISSGMRRSSNY